MFSVVKKWLQRGIQRPFGTPFAYEVSAGAIVFRVNNGAREYLLLKYRNGHWDFVKGHIEKGETCEETVKREAQEETRLQHLDIKKGFCHKLHYFYTAKGEERLKRLATRHGIRIFKTVYFYVAEVSMSEQPFIPSDSHEQSQCAWFSYEDAYAKTTFPQAREILRCAEEFLQKQIV